MSEAEGQHVLAAACLDASRCVKHIEPQRHSAAVHVLGLCEHAHADISMRVEYALWDTGSGLPGGSAGWIFLSSSLRVIKALLGTNVVHIGMLVVREHEQSS